MSFDRFNLASLIGSASKLACLMAVAAICTAPLSAQQASKETKRSSTRQIKTDAVDGKLKIVDGNGKVHVIDLGDDNQGFVLEQHVESDGQQQKKTQKAYIITSDGQQKEIDLEELNLSGDQGGRIILRAGDDENAIALPQRFLSLNNLEFGSGQDFMIGVNCSELSDGIKANLKLNHGLMVDEVVEEGPAAEAGVKQYDILVEIDGDDLKNIDQLVEAVQKSGEKETSLDIEALRAGDKMTITIKPEKRSSSGVFRFSIPGDFQFNDAEGRIRLKEMFPEGGKLGNEFSFERFGPGIIQGFRANANADEMTAEMAELKKQIAELKKQIQEMKDK